MRMFSFHDLISSHSDDEVIEWLRNNPHPEEDSFGITAAAQAAYGGRSDLVRRILTEKLSPSRSYGSSVIGGAFQCQPESEGVEILRMALKNGGFPFESEGILIANYFPELNEPLVHAAIRRRRKDLLHVLLESGASLDMIDGSGLSGKQLLLDIDGMSP